MIPISGMSSLTALKIYDALEQSERTVIENTAQHSRAISSFEERIASITSVDDLLDDYEVYSFVMKSFDLEDYIYGKAMIEKILKSDADDSSSLVNKMNDERFTSLYNALGFGTDGVGNLYTAKATTEKNVINQFLTQYIGFDVNELDEDTLDYLYNSSEYTETITAFKASWANADSLEDLLADEFAVAFISSAFSLEEGEFSTSDLYDFLTSDASDEESAISTTEDERLQTMYQLLGNGTSGFATLQSRINSLEDDLPEQYVDYQIINTVAEDNETLATAIEFRNKAADIDSAYDILKDEDMAEFIRTVLSLPDEFAQLDIDKQAKIIAEKLNFEDFQDPEYVEKLVTKYVVIRDAVDGTATSNNAAVQLLSGTSSSTSLLSAIIDVAEIDLSAFKVYR
ncbi:DUF1217 domain-containing protein [Albibacillus kandeliae]|uniref:DUF1217 domain-containing protein n=1 Tax=Albibacillus kandeliae TaxID=2174228 RepID=UPI000D6930BC|nr:DUF1217 domain-containing protein [Albibacillus kandeliae]